MENDADKETRSFPTPKFISESSHILVNEGDTVSLILVWAQFYVNPENIKYNPETDSAHVVRSISKSYELDQGPDY